MFVQPCLEYSMRVGEFLVSLRGKVPMGIDQTGWWPGPRRVIFSGLLLLCCVLVSCERQTVVQDSQQPTKPPGDGQPVAPSIDSGIPADAAAPKSLVVSLESRLLRKRAAKHDHVLDPSKDGWDSEAFSEQAQRVIDQFAKLGLGNITSNADELDKLLSADFRCSTLRPPQLKTVFDDGNFTVRRATSGWSPAAEHQGGDGARLALTELSKLFVKGHAPGIHTKTVRVTRSQKDYKTLHLIEVLAAGSRGPIEQHLKWNCHWVTEGDLPRLTTLRAVDFEENTSKSHLFSDQTERILGRTYVYREQLKHGLNHWLERIETTHGMYVFAEYGIAVGDVNGDQMEDLYICQPGGLPNRLLVRSADGTLVDQSSQARVDWLDHTSSALLLDFDNDGDQDLALAVESKRVMFMKNDGTGLFSDATSVPIVNRHVQGLSSADFDNDGDLDVYLTIGFADEKTRLSEGLPSFVYHDANEGGANVLLRNDTTSAGWAFTDVTRAVGLERNNRRHSLAAAWEDFDNDGDQDLYVANDYGQNCFYENKGGKFQDVAIGAGLVDFGSGMSVSWSDYDHDGNMDLYVGNMFSSAGNRVTRQAAFHRQVAPETRSILTRFSKGNSLFRNLGNDRFEEVGGIARIELGRWAWSSLFCDINNDGWEDVFVANGYVSNEDERDL